MNDTHNVKSLLANAITGTQLDSVALAYARVASTDSKVALRRFSNPSLVSTLRISHQPRKAVGDTSVQRTLCAFDQARIRLDENDIPTGVYVNSKVAFQCDIPSGLTAAEFKSDVRRLIGLLAENDCALVDALFNTEQ